MFWSRRTKPLSGVAGTPLCKERKEIRLLQLFPLGPDGVVRCSLEIVSLNDKTPEYSRHLGPSVLSGAALRNRVSDWVETGGRDDVVVAWKHQNRWPQHSPCDPVENSMNALVPPPNRVRFRWGEFAALSYVWGRKVKGRIFVDGEKRKVTSNLEEALRALAKDSVFATKGFRIWIDALCINQSDGEECAHQVGMMSNLYGQAWRVLAWLGPAADQSNEAMALLRRMAPSESGEFYTSEAGRYSDLNINGSYGLAKLLMRIYWTRLWVVQEVLLGREATVILVGDQLQDFPSLYNAAGKIFAHELAYTYHLRSYLSKSMNSIDLTFAPTVSLGFAMCYRADTPLRLHDLLGLCGSNCTSPSDKLFGLLGLMPPEIGSQLAPLRNSSMAEVCTQATITWIQETKSLDPLRFANPWGPTTGPSWTIDWRYEPPDMNFYHVANLPFNAHLNISPAYRTLDNGSTLLECEGLVVGRICGLGATVNRKSAATNWSNTAVPPPPSWSHSYGPRLRWALGRCLLYDRRSHDSRLGPDDDNVISPLDFRPSIASRRGQAWWTTGDEMSVFEMDKRKLWADWLDCHGHLVMRSENGNVTTIYSLLAPDLDASQSLSREEVSKVLSGASALDRGRRLIFTEEGLIGVATDNIHGTPAQQVRVGDWVVVLFGCSTPLVIRPTGKQFLVLGEAYVQGIMDGEAVEKWQKDECEKRKFRFV